MWSVKGTAVKANVGVIKIGYGLRGSGLQTQHLPGVNFVLGKTCRRVLISFNVTVILIIIFSLTSTVRFVGTLWTINSGAALKFVQ